MLNGDMVDGRYRLVELIGRGGMSVVWRAHDDVLNRTVAVKMVSHLDDPRLRRLLRDEARAAGGLNHARIAQVYDYGETDAGLPYIVMEFVEGEPLSRWMRPDTALPWRDAVSIGAQIADALAAAHARGLVHRDIKPDNVIMTPGGLKVIDFGISAAIGDADSDDDGRLLGTPAFVAPERIIGAPVGGAADIYSLGVLLYCMLSGHLPWDEDTRTRVLHAHLLLEPAPLGPIDGLPPAIANLVAACLDKEPQVRPIAAVAAAVLEQVGAGTKPTSLASRGAVVGSTGVAGSGAVMPDGSVPDGLVRDGSVRDAGADQATGAGPAIASVPSLGSVPPTARTRAMTRTMMLTAPVRHRSRRTTIAAGSIAIVVVGALIGAWALWGRDTPSAATPTAQAQCQAGFAVVRDSGTDFTANLTVANVGTVDEPAWQASFAFPGRQTIETGKQVTVTPREGSPYSATLIQSGTSVLIRPTTDEPLHPGSTVTVPIHATYQGTNPLPTDFRIGGSTCAAVVTGATSVVTTPANHGGGDGNGGGHGNGDGGGHGKGKD